VVELSVLSSLAGWLDDVWDQITEIDPIYLVIGCTLQTGQTFLNGLAWRNILRASFPEEHVPLREIFAAYAGGIGLNSFLPAQAGTIAYLGMYRAIIANSKMVTIVAGGIAQNLFYAAVGTAVYIYLFASRGAASTEVDRELTADGWWKIALLGCAVALLVLVLRFLWRRFRSTWEQAKAGAVILTTPRRYCAQVLLPQVCSYILRMGVMATFMHAFGIPVSVRNIFLIIAANSISTTLAVTPGGVGTQQALATVALRSVAPAATVTAYSLAQQMILMAWNIVFGLAMMATTFGWSTTRDLIRSSRKKSKEGGLRALEEEDAR
jgi:uncharacterized membrane protein YbhN (UPF0104 family)